MVRWAEYKDDEGKRRQQGEIVIRAQEIRMGQAGG